MWSDFSSLHHLPNPWGSYLQMKFLSNGWSGGAPRLQAALWGSLGCGEQLRTPYCSDCSTSGRRGHGSNINWGQLTGDRLPLRLGIKVGVLAAACVPPPCIEMKVLQAVSSSWRAGQQPPFPKEAHPVTRSGVEQLPMGEAGESLGLSVMSSVQWRGEGLRASVPPPQSGALACGSDSQHWI